MSFRKGVAAGAVLRFAKDKRPFSFCRSSTLSLYYLFSCFPIICSIITFCFVFANKATHSTPLLLCVATNWAKTRETVLAIRISQGYVTLENATFRSHWDYYISFVFPFWCYTSSSAEIYAIQYRMSFPLERISLRRCESSSFGASAPTIHNEPIT